MPLQVELVSPDGILFEGEASMVIARTLDGGDIAFLPGHVPFLGALATYPVKVLLEGGGSQSIAASRGFISVNGDKVTVLSDTAVVAHEIDVAEAEAELAEAEERLRADAEDEEAAADKRWAEVRIDVARGSDRVS
jgi:F-type H+-transporting ATPase subunit epsilon